MKKTTNANIGGRVFTLEEDAYADLTTYLKAVEKNLGRNPDKEEILADIESAIAERLSQQMTKYKQVITAEDINALKRTMGSAEEFGEEEDAGDETVREENEEPKKLYRNPDDMAIAGVASGIAAYFGIDVVIIRILFVLATVFWGWGIVLYIILWIVMPEAKSVSDKLRMRGRPITIEKIEEYATTIADKTKRETQHVMKKVKEERLWKRIFLAPFVAIGAVLRAIGKILRRLGPIVRVFIGSAFVLGGVVAAIAAGISIFGFFLHTDQLQSGLDIYALTAPHQPILVAIILYGLLIIPIIFVLLAGLSLIIRRSLTPAWLAIPLLLLWVGGITYGGILALDIAPNARAIEYNYRNAPMAEREYTPEPFDRVNISGNHTITILQGDTYHATVRGTEDTINDADLVVENNTLRLRHPYRICIFCNRRALDITITAPTLTTIDLRDATQASIPELSTTEGLEFILSGASKADAIIISPSIKTTLSGASSLSLVGEVDTMALSASGASKILAKNFATKRITMHASGASTLELSATESIIGTLSGASTLLHNSSLETISVDTSGSSRIETMDEE
jgi:phage shock protein PspC (stress-responsive transcriptional regulator)